MPCRLGLSTMSSRWAVDEDEQRAAATERKRQKDEKRRAREEKQKRAAEETERRQARGPGTPQNGPSTSSPQAQEETANLLRFPISNFGRTRSLDAYDVLNNIEEGSYGFVSRARERATGEIVALKRLKIERGSNDGFPVTGLREIQTLRTCSHPHVVFLREVIIGPSPSQE